MGIRHLNTRNPVHNLNANIIRKEFLLTICLLQAADWGLENPLWKGRLRILEKESTGAVIVLEDGQTGARKSNSLYYPPS
jgi:hypothetical protein